MMRCVKSQSFDPSYNLALEEVLFGRAERGGTCLMLWRNDPTVVIGRYQNTEEEINGAYVRANGIRVVRRLSGGGAVYHDRGNLNYTVITDQEGHDSFRFESFVRPVIRTLAAYGVRAELTGRNDLTAGGLKISGSAQYRKNGRILHHGCIMLNTDLDAVSEALAAKSVKYESRGIRSVRSRVTTVGRCLGRVVPEDSFAEDLLRHLAPEGGITGYALTEAERAAAGRLADEKYRTWKWNYGASPFYNRKLERRFPFGTVAVYLAERGGVIEALRVCGDFFGERDIRGLEKALEGRKIAPGLAGAAEGADAAEYICGMTNRELEELILDAARGAAEAPAGTGSR